MSDTMRAVRFHEYGDSSMLLVEEVARPSPKAGQLLVKVRYAGVNPIDWKLRAGLYREFMPVRFPSTPGREFSGVVENVGSDVRGFSKGQRVYGTANGTYAEYVVVKASDAALIPENISDEEAASVPLGALTAWSVVEDAELKPGQHVLVVGAAGGVGLFLVQFSRLKGAKVTGIASTGNLSFIESLGAEAVDYTAGPLAAKIAKADVILDTVGGKALEDAYALVKRGGLAALDRRHALRRKSRRTGHQRPQLGKPHVRTARKDHGPSCRGKTRHGSRGGFPILRSGRCAG